MSTKSLLTLAIDQYDLSGVELGVFGSVRRGGKIAPVWNIPLVVYQGMLAHRMLIVLLPGKLGLFSPKVLRGRGTAGGLESLERGSHMKLACQLPLNELKVVRAVRVSGTAAGGQGSVVALRHSSGREFTISSFSQALAHRIRSAVSG